MFVCECVCMSVGLFVCMCASETESACVRFCVCE